MYRSIYIMPHLEPREQLRERPHIEIDGRMNVQGDGEKFVHKLKRFERRIDSDLRLRRKKARYTDCMAPKHGGYHEGA